MNTKARVASATVESPGRKCGEVPGDTAVASARGLDPDTSAGNTLAQVPHDAQARETTASTVRRLVITHITERTLGLFGDPRPNALETEPRA